jgi:hypothetical protein
MVGVTKLSLVVSSDLIGVTLLRKEVIHPHLPVRIPCYDLILIAGFTLPRNMQDSGAPNFADLTGGVYKTRERIHRGMTDPRLLPIPRS